MNIFISNSIWNVQIFIQEDVFENVVYRIVVHFVPASMC